MIFLSAIIYWSVSYMNTDQLAAQFGRSFQSLLRAYELCMQQILAKYGLYPGQPQLLFALSRLEKPTQMQLSRELGISKASAGVSLRRMESGGFLRRVRDKRDTRCIRIVLTDKGKDYAKWCEIDFAMLFSTMLENLDYDQREDTLELLDSISGSLIRLKARLEA